MFLEVFTLAEKVSHETDGAFGYHSSPDGERVGIRVQERRAPTKHVIDSLEVYRGLSEGGTVDGMVKNRTRASCLDCSAIAKGYTAATSWQDSRARKGIKNYMIEIGGEIVTSGISSKRVPWKIGVTKPTDDSLNTNTEIQTILNVT